MTDYKNKYNDALADMKVIYPNLKGDAKRAVEHAFPELKESEDERIRKCLLAHFSRYQPEEIFLHSITMGDIVAYLEKQKDIEDRWIEDREQCFWDGVEEGKMLTEKQKDASKAIEAVERIDKYIDEHLANAHDMKDSNPDKKYYRGWDDALGEMAGILQDVYSDEKQKEQKPSTPEDIAAAYQMGLAKGRNEQKPAEWSEEDEEYLNFFIDIAESLIDDEDCGDMTYKEHKEFYQKRISWLKFLRPQPHWKPSEEQLLALKMHSPVNVPDINLVSLYDDLLKLL